MAMIAYGVFATVFVWSQVLADGSQKSSALSAYEEGVRLVRDNDIRSLGDKTAYEMGIRKLELAVQLDDKFVDAYMALAAAYWHHQLFFSASDATRVKSREKSLASYRKVIKLKPDLAEAYAQLSIGTNDKEEQVTLLKKTIQFDPQHGWARSVLARTLLSQKKLDEAIEQYRLYMKDTPYRRIQDAHGHAAFANALTIQGRLKDAVEIYENTLKLARVDRPFQRCVLVRNVNLEQFSKYKSFASRVRQLKRYCTNLDHYNRAVQLLREKKTDEAIEQLELQRKVNPYIEGTYVALEDIYKGRGQPEKALAIVKSYFAVQRDRLDQCRYFSRRDKHVYRKLDGKFIDQLAKQCAGG